MTIKHIKPLILSSLVLFSAFLTGCESKLDIIPKGETTLDNIEDLELLLNQEYSFGVSPAADISLICNESTGSFVSIPEVIASKNSLNNAYLTYNESIDRKMLCQNDERYSAIYRYVNFMNTILTKIDGVAGTEERKSGIKAKARIMRAYLHWLCVCIHARQYDSSWAEKEGGIAYVEDIDNNKVKQKISLAATYEKILEDCSEGIIALLPVNNSDISQADRAFGFAVRGKVLMQMKRYGEAAEMLTKALEINGAIEDRSYIKNEGEWMLQRTVSNHFVWIGYGVNVSPTTETISLETNSKFEKNDYVIKYCGATGWDYGMGKMHSGLEGIRMYMGWNTCNNPYGITSDILYYDLAECLIRTGEIREGLAKADMVRKLRIENYSPFTRIHDLFPLSEKAAMALIQPAKWIECIGTYQNFFDCKRWNSEEDYRTEISRDLKEYGTYTLSPDSPLWILPFPASATRHNPTLTQNY